MNDLVIVERSGAVAIVTMNRPQILNVLDEALADQLLQDFKRLAADASVRVVILRGAGRSFMGGGDLSRFRADLDRAPVVAENLIDMFHALLRLIATMRQPVIAAVQGPVAGGGVSLALACDMVVAAESATLLSAYTKLGTNPDGGLTWTLTHLIGPRRAMDFILLNDPMKASEALRLGLVSEVVPDADLGAATLKRAERLCLGFADAQARVKKLVREASGRSFQGQLDEEKTGFVQSAGQDDFRRGIEAFFSRSEKSRSGN